ncbi:aldo/keto reductase [Saccharothrix violaceirubra]|uniref:Aryl-alcohol dehydrogenase-like predicted oxidoreductase n=1 Tax=Saccharothrix violaceirubra TaxID=413306 RepID=A0A7W7T0W8_9PSEU|nr:aldo/keto reductase [Saccharothrix violaceirubra]MBB4964510.1 aryl-alcohol dehydrogenase-like predicted oxidoreductase [Saccharothrix violaceirubra]
MSETYALGGDLTVGRLGYGAMRITGPGIWGYPDDPENAIAVLRRAVELGVTFIDTADSYGPHVSEDLIRRALHPYADDLVIATKAGLVRPSRTDWVPLGRPEYLRHALEQSLVRLGVERIDLFQLHRIDPSVPLADQIGELKKFVDEGKVRHVGLSEVDVDELAAAREITEIASVQNLYNLADRKHEKVLDYTIEHEIAFIPWYPVATGDLARPGGVLDQASRDHGATPAQLALAWLLRRAPNILPIPGTSSLAHLAENVAAAKIELTDEEFAQLSGL